MTVSFLRRPTNYPSGIASGGGDTGFDTQPQKTTLLKKVSQAAVDVLLPKGTVILSTIVMPDSELPAEVGTVTVESWDRVGNAAVHTFVAGASAAAYSETLPATTTVDGAAAINGIIAGGTILAVDTRFRITPAGIGAGTAALAGFQVLLPRIRV